MSAIIEKAATANFPTKYGNFLIHGFVNKKSGEHHVALTMGDITNEEEILVRIHSECLTGDALGSERCDCGDQYQAAMKMISKAGKGILVYLRQEGRGIGLINKVRAYELQDQGLDTVEANIKLGFLPDLREYEVGALILKTFGISQITLLTNNPEKISGLEKYGIKIVSRVPLETKHKKNSNKYMQTKKKKMGHILKSYKE